MADDSLDGDEGSDRLNGGAGDDTLYSLSAGSDALNGGARGEDIAEIDRTGYSGNLTLNISNPVAVQTLADGTTVVNIEKLVHRMRCRWRPPPFIQQVVVGPAVERVVAGAAVKVIVYARPG